MSISLSAPSLHPTALVNPNARLAAGVKVGPYCLVDGDVTLEEGVELISHVCVSGRTRVGAYTQIFPFASIGHRCQDLKYAGEPSTLEIGAHNTIREYVTIHPGTQGGGMVTRVGDGCLLMIGAHVAHDCHVGNKVILANNATLAGHVSIGDGVIVGGLSAIHQFVRIGAYAIIGGMSGVELDVIPYGSVLGNRAHLQGLNWVGLKRLGLDKPNLQTLRHAFYQLFALEGTLQDRLDTVARTYGDQAQVAQIVEFMKHSDRGFCLPQTHKPARLDDAASSHT